jgi:hypothetical protein
MSDRLKGSTNRAKSPYGFSTAGPRGWKGPSTQHLAFSRGGRQARDTADEVRNRASVEQHQGGRAAPHRRRFAIPEGTHGETPGAILNPEWSIRNPVGKPAKEPPRKKRTKRISAR